LGGLCRLDYYFSMKTRQRNVIVAAIDIGSNSVKLAVAEAAAKAAKDSSDSFKIVWQERERARACASRFFRQPKKPA
jgi:hypothetical protein